MGLLDEVVKHVAAQGGGDPSHAAMANAVMGMLTNQSGGGLASVVQALQSKGLGDVVNSWVGTGTNRTISPDQLHNALGADQIARLGQQAGLSPDVAKAALAVVLPLVIDKLTPGGRIPQQSSLLGEGLDLLKKFT
jgi:uncharacterized protein YidB (DUF937 family)